jgi:hypothetical protein
VYKCNITTKKQQKSMAVSIIHKKMSFNPLIKS